MTKLHWFPFYGRDFFFDERVKLFTLRQHGIYLFLLWHQWEEGSIPSVEVCQRFPSFLADPLAVSPDSIHDIEVVHNSCFEKHPTEKQRFYNRRLEAVRVEQIEKSQKLHERAVKGGLAKAQRKQSLSIHQAMPKQSLSYAIQSQSQIQRKKDPEKSVSLPHRVEDRTTKGFEHLGSGLAAQFAQLAQESDEELIVKPETGV